MLGIASRLLKTRFYGGFVLAFHEIPPKQLEVFVQCLHPAKPVPLSDLVNLAKRRKSTSGLFAITIDDGVGYNVRALTELFLSKAWPATFYVPTQYLDTAQRMMFQWWRRIKPFLPRRKLEVTGGYIDLSEPRAIDTLSARMALLWYTGPLESYQQLTMELVDVARSHAGSEAIEPPGPITWEEVAKLSNNPLIRFESHGVSHTAMSSLSDEKLEFEMKHSQRVVEEHTGHPCRHLAYPFGCPESIGNRAAACAHRFYDSATTMSLGSIDCANPWLLPRIPLYPENSRSKARLKVLLKCHSVRANLRGSRPASAELPSREW